MVFSDYPFNPNQFAVKCFKLYRKEKISFCLVMGLGQKLLTQVRSGQFFFARAVSGQPSMVWVWKISPKTSNFSLCVKKISSGWVKKYLGQRRVGLLFTADQK